jgi:hypothetical protein
VRTILLSPVNEFIPALALLIPIGSVHYDAGTMIQPTPPEMIAFVAGAFAAAIVAVAFCTLRCVTTPPFQETRHD